MIRVMVLMITGLTLAYAADATSASDCAENSMRVRIVDEGISPGRDVPSVNDIADPHFRAFVSAVSEQLWSRIAQVGPCPEGSAEPGTEILFLRQPLVTSGDTPFAPAPSLDRPSLDRQPSDGCRIASPWLDLAVERTPPLRIRAVVRWSERQLLQDQVVLAGGGGTPAARPEPLTRSAFERLAQDYADSEILGRPTAAARPLEDRIPPDVLWLFRRSWQSTRGPFSGAARGAMGAALERGGEGYTNLVIALIDQCFAPGVGRLDYDSVLDLTDILSLEQYRIDQLL